MLIEHLINLGIYFLSVHCQLHNLEEIASQFHFIKLYNLSPMFTTVAFPNFHSFPVGFFHTLLVFW